MVIYVDLDNTLCETIGTDYENSQPITKRIEYINKYFDQGHSITIYTARGSLSKIDYYELTKNQLESWGVKYNSLIVGEKPVYDLLIDDKALSDIEFFKSIE
tara:strand:- start:3183 stop:3488 length:306 start_codon:yes stop_codon:yes gene_type:complete